MVTTLKVETLNESERPATLSIIYNWWHTYWNKTCLKICVTSSHIGHYFSTLSYIHYVRIFSFASDNQISHEQATPNLKAISLPTYCLQLVNLLLSRNTMHFVVSHNLSIIGLSDCCLMSNEQFFSYIMVRTSYIPWDDNNVQFVLD